MTTQSFCLFLFDGTKETDFKVAFIQAWGHDPEARLIFTSVPADSADRLGAGGEKDRYLVVDFEKDRLTPGQITKLKQAVQTAARAVGCTMVPDGEAIAHDGKKKHFWQK